MLIVGELINASRKPIAEAIRNQDAEAIKKIAKDQYEAGADYIDVNAGIFVGQEGDYMEWLIKNVQEAVSPPVSTVLTRRLLKESCGTQRHTDDQLHLFRRSAMMPCCRLYLELISRL